MCVDVCLGPDYLSPFLILLHRHHHLFSSFLLRKHTFTLFTVSPFLSLSLFVATHARNIFNLFFFVSEDTQLNLPFILTRYSLLLSVLSLSSLPQLIFSPPSDPGRFLFLLFVESVQCIIISAC